MNNLNVLVVDDEPTNLEIAEVILKSAGHSVLTANNGAEAVALMIDQGRRFDLVLMDLLMPVMDGLEAIRLLRAHPSTKDVPILCVSAKASHIEVGEGMSAGCYYYLTKPFKRQALLDAIDETLTKLGVEDSGS